MNELHYYIPVVDSCYIKTFIDGLFYYGDRQYEIVKFEDGKTYLKEKFHHQNWRTIALKILSLATIVIPAISLGSMARNAYLCRHNYKLISPVHFIPAEITQHVFTFWNPSECQISVQVSKDWNTNIQAATKQEQISLAKNLIEFFKANLDQVKYKEMFENCQKIFAAFQVQRTTTLLELKKSLENFKFDLALKLRVIDREELYSLKSQINALNKPQFFDDLVDLIWALTRVHYAEIEPEHSSFELRYTAQKLVELKYVDRIKTLLEGLPDNLDKSDAYIALAKALIKIGEVDQAAEIAKRIAAGLKKNPLLEKLTNVFLEKDDIDRAIEMTKMMEEYAKTINLEKVINALLEKGEYDAAIENFRALAPANHMILKKIAEFFISKEDFDWAFTVAKIAEKEKKNTYDFSKVVKYVDKHLFKALSDLLINEEYDGSLDIAHKITYELERDYAYRFIIGVMLARDDIEGAIQLAVKIPDENPQSESLGLITEVLCAIGDVDRAITVANNIKKEFTKRFACDKIIETILAKGEEEKALGAAAKLSGSLNNVIIHLVNVLIKYGRIDEVFEMGMAAQKGDGPLTILCIVEALSEKGEIVKAQDVISKFILDVPESDAAIFKFMSEISILLSQHGPDEAIPIFKQKYGNSEQYSLVLAVIATLFLKKGERDRALNLAKEIADVKLKSVCLLDILIDLINSDQFDKSFEVIQSESASIEPFVYWHILKTLLKDKKFEQAEKIAAIIPGENRKTDALIRIRALQGKIDEAVRLAMSNEDTKDINLKIIAEKLYKMGDLAEAADIALKISQFRKDQMLLKIVVKLAENDIPTANEYLKHITSDNDKQSAIARVYLNQNRYEEAIEAAVDLHSFFERDDVIKMIIKKKFGIIPKQNKINEI